jgi:hypothetical protein
MVTNAYFHQRAQPLLVFFGTAEIVAADVCRAFGVTPSLQREAMA